MNNQIYRYILLPTFAPLSFLVVATTPVDVLGCATRGLLAVAIAYLSVLAGLASAFIGARGRTRGNPDANWWATSALILSVPAVLLIIFA